MAELGLNVFQVLQNELITRETSRSTLGIGFRLSIIEERIKNAAAKARNGQIWRLQHAIHGITALTPETRVLVEREKERLMHRKGAKSTDQKDPTKLIRQEESWEVHRHFPRTVLEFKELQFHLEWIRSLLEFYSVKVYRPDMRPVIIDPADHCRDIHLNLEVCMEELALNWGLNWFRIGGLTLPSTSSTAGSSHQTSSYPSSMV